MMGARLIDDHDWRAMPVNKKLEHYLTTAPKKDDDFRDYRERYNFMDDILDCFGSYNGAVDEHIRIVIRQMLKGKFFASTLAKEHGWPEEYPELISYILCHADLAEYGTSPRGAWIQHDLRPLLERAIERWAMDYADPTSKPK